MMDTVHDGNDFVVWFDDSNMPPAGAKMPEISKEEEAALFSHMDALMEKYENMRVLV